MTDPFLIAPLRALGYGYAVGVALRYRFCQDLKDACYVTATTYILCHTLHRGFTELQTQEGSVAIAVVDTLIFQSLASAAMPTLTTYCICKITRDSLRNIDSQSKDFYRWMPLTFGLAVLPFLYGSLDSYIIKLMDRTFRPLYMLDYMYE